MEQLYLNNCPVDSYTIRLNLLEKWFEDRSELYSDKGICTDRLELKLEKLHELLEMCADCDNYDRFDEYFTMRNVNIDTFFMVL